MTARALVTVNTLDAAYGDGPAVLRGVSFSAFGGRIVGVLGPNGGGKTTLFRALLGELPIRRGDLRVHGTTAYVPQTERSRLDFPVSALDVALMGAYADLPWHRRMGAIQRRAAADALARVGLEEVARTPYGALSGGQRQRVLIARALVQNAEVLLLDEPLTGVDRPGAERIESVLRDLRSEGRALLVATHDVGQARSFDEVLCLNEEQVAFGAPEPTLTGDTLARTYGGELVLLEDGGRAAVVQSHAHS
ncbi:MAG: metal ABC transporter ATP-binding protein [Thermoleophilaceae bacterium]|nr:metal ABC transporter ATP-binding protein [Thermoleophilaceae bacterium]